MALSVPTLLGNTGAAAGATTVTLNTTATVTAGGLVIVGVSCFLAGNAATGVTFSGGGLTWAKDAQKQGVADTSRYCCIFSAQAPSGLASGTTLTLTTLWTSNNMGIGACFITGQNTTSALDAAGAGGAGTTLAWSSGNATTVTADALLFTVAHRDALVTSTASGSFTELQDFQNTTDTTSLTTGYRIVAATGSYAGSGSWNTGTTAEWVSQVAAYKAAAGGGAATTKRLAVLGVG